MGEPYRKLKALRVEFDVTQAEIAEYLDTSVPHYCMMENGKRPIKIPTAIKISEFFGVPMDEIFNAKKVNSKSNIS